ncbi:MAG TPA: hypothetical protein ENN56_04150 [Firmicutes bacterium]|nr:hypothetical protein [Bacillota bacterium]
MYHVDADIDEIADYLTRKNATILDSVVTSFFISFTLDTISLRLPNTSVIPQRFDVWMSNDCHPDTLDALRRVWQRATESDDSGNTWTEILSQFVSPIVTRGGLVCWTVNATSRFETTLAIDGLLETRLPDGFAVAVADYRGADHIRTNPELERLEGILPFLVSGKIGSENNERARTLWFARNGTPEAFRTAIHSRRAAAVIAPTDSDAPSYYGPEEVSDTLRSRTNWRWFKTRSGG